MKLIRYVIFMTLLMSSILAYGTPVVIGVATNVFPPFAEEINLRNHYLGFGFAVSIINELCLRTKEKCVYKAVTLKDQINQLNKGRVDITVLPSPIPPIPSSHYIFSLPFMTSDGVFVTSDPNIKLLKDLKQKRIGALKEAHLEDILLLYTSKNNIKKYLGVHNLIAALINDRVDAILINAALFKYLSLNKIINFHAIGKPVILGNGYGITALKKNAALIKKFNRALLDMENDGTYERIYAEYFGF